MVVVFLTYITSSKLDDRGLFKHDLVYIWKHIEGTKLIFVPPCFPFQDLWHWKIEFDAHNLSSSVEYKISLTVQRIEYNASVVSLVCFASAWE